MMPRAPRTGTWESHVSNLLLAGELAPEAVGAVVEAGLAAYALDRLGERQAGADPRLRSSRVVAMARHGAIRRATAGLVRAWSEVGIETLLFKGFYLAEFVYPDPSWRAYSDVDLALRGRTPMSPRHVADLAARVAQEHGFHLVWRLGETPSVHSFHDRDYNGHELVQLVHQETGISVDAHRRLVHSNVSLRRQSDKGEVLTGAVWASATAGELEGAPVFLPSALDSALVGLIAARSWSGDRHALRPHDLLDLEVLMRHGGFGRDELLTRARDLGLIATTRLFLRRCDPRAGIIDLRAPGPSKAFVFDALLVGERGHRGLAQTSAAVQAAPGRVWSVFRELPAAASQLRRVRAGRRPEWTETAGTAEAAEAWTEGRLDRRTWRATQLGVRRALKVLGTAPERERELALACLHRSLTRRGYAVRRRWEDGRLWLEAEGQPLPLDVLGRVADPGRGARRHGWPVDAVQPLPRVASTWSRLRNVGWAGALLRLEALLLLRRIHTALDTHTFQEVRAAVLTDRSGRPGAGADRARSVGRAVESAARYVPGALCVPQALAAQVMLARRGAASTIHFGFLREPTGAVKGHAWLEVDGAVAVGDGLLESFTRTATFET